MFGFTFTGTKGEFDVFKDAVEHQLLNTKLTIKRIDGDDIDCEMVDDPQKCFCVGMILAQVYKALGR